MLVPADDDGLPVRVGVPDASRPGDAQMADTRVRATFGPVLAGTLPAVGVRLLEQRFGVEAGGGGLAP
jgi:hypothetical protein